MLSPFKGVNHPIPGTEKFSWRLWPSSKGHQGPFWYSQTLGKHPCQKGPIVSLPSTPSNNTHLNRHHASSRLDFSIRDRVHCNCSHHQGSVGQCKKRRHQPIFYENKMLTRMIVFAISKFNPTWFVLRCYYARIMLHPSSTKKGIEPRLTRWIILLQEVEFEIRDKKRADNFVANHLSRIQVRSFVR